MCVFFLKQYPYMEVIMDDSTHITFNYLQIIALVKLSLKLMLLLTFCCPDLTFSTILDHIKQCLK